MTTDIINVIIGEANGERSSRAQHLLNLFISIKSSKVAMKGRPKGIFSLMNVFVDEIRLFFLLELMINHQKGLFAVSSMKHSINFFFG